MQNKNVLNTNKAVALGFLCFRSTCDQQSDIAVSRKSKNLLLAAKLSIVAGSFRIFRFGFCEIV